MLEQLTTWLASRLPDYDVREDGIEGDHFIWRVDRPDPEAAPVFLEIPAPYVRGDALSTEELTAALDRERLKGRITEAGPDRESAWRLTRETEGRVKELTLVETDPPAHTDRSVRQPPDAPGPVPR